MAIGKTDFAKIKSTGSKEVIKRDLIIVLQKKKMNSVRHTSGISNNLGSMTQEFLQLAYLKAADIDRSN